MLISKSLQFMFAKETQTKNSRRSMLFARPVCGKTQVMGNTFRIMTKVKYKNK